MYRSIASARVAEYVFRFPEADASENPSHLRMFVDTLPKWSYASSRHSPELTNRKVLRLASPATSELVQVWRESGSQNMYIITNYVIVIFVRMYLQKNVSVV